ncbi:hypothetical protein GIB67_032584 [Kingdonia uniflora]|uniref:Uncharacterized protein n=1 Tax=Kingdonia uniflora TaxID=39325 RepID=A0A7J7LS28_9MAGN|nr:hypothetical protein GIB67_032584 [Kingdonia uniflora]
MATKHLSGGTTGLQALHSLIKFRVKTSFNIKTVGEVLVNGSWEVPSLFSSMFNAMGINFNSVVIDPERDGTCVWKPDTKGVFTVKSAYNVIRWKYPKRQSNCYKVLSMPQGYRVDGLPILGFHNGYPECVGNLKTHNSQAAVHSFNHDTIPWQLSSLWLSIKYKFARKRITAVWREVNFGADQAAKRGSNLEAGAVEWHIGRPSFLQRIEDPYVQYYRFDM